MATPKEIAEQLPSYGPELEQLWKEERSSFDHKLIVLDDDPTGVQTVHNIPVFTDWSEETIRAVFAEKRQMAFILTNSRAFSEEQTKQVHQDIAERIARVAKETGNPFLIISRGDSTLRGHYPLETETLRNTLEQNLPEAIDGEILLPFFKEGGRETIGDVHYVKSGDNYVPAGETEFAKDRMFGYKSSDLKDYVEEKTGGAFKSEDVLSVTLDELRALDLDSITDQLMSMTGFGKMVVNAVDEEDVRAFSIALLRSIKRGKRFIFRTAAAFTKVIGDVPSKPILTKEELLTGSEGNGGLIIVGSHVKKTTEQLEQLKTLDSIRFIEFRVKLVADEEQFAEEIERIQNTVNESIAEGTSVCVYTSRERLDLGEGRREEELAQSVKISEAVTTFVRNCAPQPAYVIAKGGITSSDIGTKGLGVKKAEVIGQAAPGVPVWKTGQESVFPEIPYIIFPGNVGDADTLKTVVARLES
ncbi:four-carbon acid sugar kinase family protein [Bhargavaea massiliensis]|uniref:four-carbon acid sugar kinase family protein n=1 Tax=Bhargavaea massiliensis TaxID=2697500 RepID=UPI001F267FE5|nr:four-carbon acid sugar kinase family protein [Bhargavaea massiliensis]